MALLLVPYNNSMRLGQGFNSFTQQVCIDNAVVGISDPEDSQPLTPGTYAPIAKDGAPAPPAVSAPIKKDIDVILNDSGGNRIVRYPSQIVTYTSKYVSKLSDVSNDLNISGSLSIRYGEISGGGSGSYVNTETFQDSDVNFVVVVKVINQTINIKDQLQFWPLSGRDNYTAQTFTDIYGDCFISGFQEGGQFSAIVSIRARDKSQVTEIAAKAHLALQVGVGSVDAEGAVKSAKSFINKNSEVNITVNWSGGGQLKEDPHAKWDIDTLQDVAVRFADLVAACPQRTHAILTKYTALRGYLQWKPATLQPLDYEIANLYTSELLDVYMGYKRIWKDIHVMLEDAEDDPTVFEKAPAIPGDGVRMPPDPDAPASPTPAPGAKIDPFEPTIAGLDAALKCCRQLMVKIVTENDQITRDPKLAIDSKRSTPYIRPQTFRLLLPQYKVGAVPWDPIGALPVDSSPGGTPSTPVKVGLRSGYHDFRFDNETTNINVLNNSTLEALVPLSPPITTPADGILCLNKVDLRRQGTDPRTIAQASMTEIRADQYKPRLSTMSTTDNVKTRCNQLACTSLLVPRNDQVQVGMWSMPYRQPTNTARPGLTTFRQRVDFRVPYTSSAPPLVTVFLAGFDFDSTPLLSAHVAPDNIDNKGFDMVVTFSETARQVHASWFACPPTASNIVCGTSPAFWLKDTATEIVARKTQVSFQGAVTMPTDAFKSPPRAFLGPSGFVMGKDWDVRLQSRAQNLTEKGFDWNVNTVDDTPLMAASASWVMWAE
ncbi:hypothetical protein A1O7_02421 [Cladophialophora yegresii CBS 114405]|uniref:H-type lectin domain-containing protein n=1 Tax=Cladophialophora yegresii CBS 114405 TaxID=1182544 RepID=W9WUK9_9EURO|nr:uncharacterized protein A1O7_02421 [Cladophialophora yegresii CBS 114405]EXJ61989.1 hypothetical protein A1O7_02421 [Cladophialophora yegresii CBS 114405]